MCTVYNDACFRLFLQIRNYTMKFMIYTVLQVTCDLCDKNIKVSHSSTSNLYQHLQRHHPKEYSSVAPKASVRGLNPDYKEKNELGQKTLFEMVPYDKNKDRHKALVSAVTNYLISGQVPLYTVDKKSFRNMLSTFDSRFKCPSRNYFTNTAIPETYNIEKAKLIENLQSISYFSCTMDGWTSIAGDPYLSLTIHYIDHEWTLHTKCLSTMYMPNSHTGDALCSFTVEGLAEFSLYSGKMAFMTTDSAANNVAACRKIPVERIPCFGHILHNALTNALNEDQDIVAITKATRKIVSVFSYSFEARKKLIKIKKQMNINAKSLIQDVPTRWGSRFKMLQSLHSQIAAVNELFVNNRKHRDLMLSQSQSDLLTLLVDFLQPFAQLTDLLSGDQMVTLSSLTPMIIKIEGLCNVAENDSDNITNLKTRIWEYVSSKFCSAHLEKLNLHISAATMLDRRYTYK